MAILVPALGMPETCSNCFAYYDGYCRASREVDEDGEHSRDVSYKTYNKKREPYCTLKEVSADEVVARDCYDRILVENDKMREQLARIGKRPGEEMGDVRKIVFCQDCRYCRTVDEYEHWCEGLYGPARLIRADDFCSHGERRNEQ